MLAALTEAARVLPPGGRLVHVGVHPCFVGAFADRSEPERVVTDHPPGRADSRKEWPSPGEWPLFP
ncbi:hypothetical protein GCM10027186_42530 [Micromonospora schwarzwaldensis]